MTMENSVEEQPLLSIQNVDDLGDSLGFSDAEEKFFHIISSLRPPMTVALYGKWGSGKTTMINRLCNTFASSNRHTIIFDAWEYRKSESLILPLMLAINSRFGSAWDEGVKKSFCRVVGGVGLSLADVLLRNTAGIKLEDVKQHIAFLEEKESLFEKFFDEIGSIKIEYKSLISTFASIDSPLIIFIDNLDRCLPDVVVNLLEDISTFLSYTDVPCIYVLAMDRDHVVAAVKKKHSDIDGNMYLEKIIHIPLTMPRARVLKDFINSRLSIYASWLTNEKLERLNVELKHLANFFESEFTSNPRRLDRILKRLAIVYALYQTQDCYSREYSLTLLILFLFIKEYYPNIFALLHDNLAREQLIRLSKSSNSTDWEPEGYKRQVNNFKLSQYQKLIADEYIKGGFFSEMLKSCCGLFNIATTPRNDLNGNQLEALLQRDILEILSLLELIS